MRTHFIELAGEINSNMPGYVVDKAAAALDRAAARGLSGAKILLLGVAYKAECRRHPRKPVAGDHGAF